jgi:hypothetical protein
MQLFVVLGPLLITMFLLVGFVCLFVFAFSSLLFIVAQIRKWWLFVLLCCVPLVLVGLASSMYYALQYGYMQGSLFCFVF